jgi:stage III sporulation protein AE
MKKILILLFSFALAAALTPASYALDTTPAPDAVTAAELEKRQADALGLDKLEKALPESAGDILRGMRVTDSLDLNAGVGRLFDSARSNLGGIVASSVKNAAVILVIAVLSATVNAAFEGGAKYAVLAGVLAISAVSVSSVTTFIGLGARTLEELNIFSKMLLPTLTAAATASGAVTSAAAKYAATALFMDVMMTVSQKVIVPLIYAFTATSIAEAALGGNGLAGASNLLKWLSRTVMSVMMLLFVAYLTLTGVISGTTDAVATKTLKTAFNTILPVVGGIIADASETVLAGASILRNAVGIFGLIAVIATCLLPFLRLGVNYILYKAVAGLSGSVSDGRITKLVGAVSAAFGMMMGLVGACALMLFVAIISVIKVTV